MRIALVATCRADALFPDVAEGTATVLQRLGHQVVFAGAQTCCGQMHVKTGYMSEAVPVVRLPATYSKSTCSGNISVAAENSRADNRRRF